MSERKQSPRVKLIREIARGIARAAVRELKKAEFIETTKDEEREMQDIVEYVARRELATLPEMFVPEECETELAPATLSEKDPLGATP